VVLIYLLIALADLPALIGEGRGRELAVYGLLVAAGLFMAIGQVFGAEIPSPLFLVETIIRPILPKPLLP
jgi:hypothetical protein